MHLIKILSRNPNMVRTNLRGGRPIMHGWSLMMMLKGEIVAPDHYHLLGGKTRGQGQHLIILQKITFTSLLYYNYSNSR